MASSANTDTNTTYTKPYSSHHQSSNNIFAGFIFTTDHDNISLQLQHQIFGMPLEYLERVQAIKPGLPLFLYDSSTRCLHGVFEASSSGGLNLKKISWKHRNPDQSGVTFESQYPAQVKICVRERRPCLDIEQVKSALYTYDRPQLQLELSPAEVEKLLRLFGCNNFNLNQFHFTAEDINENCCVAGISEGSVISNICSGSYIAQLEGEKTFLTHDMGTQPHNDLGPLNTYISSNWAFKRGYRPKEAFWRKKAVSNCPATGSTGLTEMGDLFSRNCSSYKNFKCGSQQDDKKQILEQKQQTNMDKPQEHLLPSSVPLLPWGFHIPVYFPYSSAHPLKDSIHTQHVSSIFSASYPFLEVSGANVHDIHSEILQFAHNVRPSSARYGKVQAAINCVRQVVKCCWPDKNIEVFGSFATGLCLTESDIDLIVVDKLCRAPLTKTPAESPASLIRVLAKEMKECRWCQRLTTVESASIPVIRLICNPDSAVSSNDGSQLKPVAIDISFQGRGNWCTKNENHDQSNEKLEAKKVTHSGVIARKFVLDKLHQFPPLAPLVLLLKSYLHHKQLNNVYFGGLGSYSLILMLVFYLEQVFKSDLDVPVTPIALKSLKSLSSFSGDSSEVEVTMTRAKLLVDQSLRLLHIVGSPNLGTLLIGFLHFFGLCIDFTRMRIVLQSKDGNAGGIFWHEESQSPTPLWIEDPLQPGVNVGAGSFAMCHVQAAFLEMLNVLTRPIQHAPDTSSEKSSLPYLDRLFYTSGK